MFNRRHSRYTGRLNFYERPYPTQMPGLTIGLGPDAPQPVGISSPSPPMQIEVAAPPALRPPSAPATITVPVVMGPTAPPLIDVPYFPKPPTAPSVIDVPDAPAVKPSIGGDPDIIDPVPEGCPTGPYLYVLTSAQALDLSASPTSALHTSANRRAATEDTTVPAGLPVLATARDILDHRKNRHTCDFRPPLADALRRLRVALPTHPWWGWLSANPAILETMVLINSGGIWNAVAPCEDFRAYKGTTTNRLGCSYGLFQINEFYAGPVYNQASLILGSCSSDLTVSPSTSRTLQQLGKYNDDPGRFHWALALCHRPQGIMWGCLFAGYYIRMFALYVDPLTGNGRGDHTKLGLDPAIAMAKSLKPKYPGAVWLRAMWIGGTVTAAAKLITARDTRLITYLNGLS